MPCTRLALRGPSVLLAFTLLALLASLLTPLSSAALVPDEVRGLWVLRDSLTSSRAVAEVVREAAANGFNTLFVQVRGRGDAYFRGGREPLAPALMRTGTTFDPLREITTLAHGQGLLVHAWMNVNLVASARDLPSSREHVINRRPEWLMVPRSLAAALRGLSPTDKRYLTRLADWSRRQPDVEGLFASPVVPEAAEYVAGIAADVAARYPIDGVHLDYVRYPTAEFDYSQAALAEFRETVLPDLTDVERQRLEARAPTEPHVYVDMFPVRWANFRRMRLTALVQRIRAEVKARRPAALLTAAVVPDGDEAVDRRLQDWSLWFDSGLLDAICPMIYTPSPKIFSEQVDKLAEGSHRARIWTGIGAYRLTPGQTASNIDVARRAGMGGVVLFSYDSVRQKRKTAEPSYLASVRRLAFDSSPVAAVPRD